MPLPKIKLPVFSCQIVSSKEPVKFRTFTVAEEKILLIAKESIEDQNVILDTVRQVINNCLITKLDVLKLPMFDIQYLFIQMRSKSVGNIIELNLRDNEDKKVYKVNFNLDDIKYTKPDNHSNIVKVNDTVGMVMKYPTINMFKNKDFENSLGIVEVLKECVDSVYDGDTIYKTSDVTKQELDEFFDNLPGTVVEEFNKFIDTMPQVSHIVSYTNSNGKVVNYEVNNLKNFF